MQFFKKSLILNISTAVLLVEFLALLSLGLFYTDRFSREVDRAEEDAISLPGELMGRQLLRYESVGDPEVMAELVGDEYQDGMVIGADGRIYYAFNPALVGHDITELKGINPGLFTPDAKPRIIRGEDSVVAVTPLTAFKDAKPFFHVYIKVGTMETQARKARILGLFIAGSLVCILLTSLAIILYSRRYVTEPLGELRHSADMLRMGDLKATIPADREDELGALADSFATMRDSIKQKIGELETANETLARREAWLDGLINAIPDLVIVLDEDGTYRDIYAPEEHLLYSSLNELKGKRLHDVMPEQMADTFLKMVRETVRTGSVQSLEYELPVQAGSRWFDARSSRVVTEDGTLSSVWLVRDITWRKEMEQRLRAARDEAERVNRQLRELDQTKSALVASVSHELRTPLTSLLGFSKLILKNFSKHFWPLAKGDHILLTKGAQIVENLNILIHEGDRLTRLIGDVLDLNRIEMGYTEWREDRIAPAELARKAASSASGAFESNPQLKLVTDVEDDLPELILDRDKMLQTLLNLLTNAAKFTPAGTVTLRVLNKDDGIVRFEVEDTGPGIPSDELERIFEVFHQASDIGPADNKPRGAGLGLAICREIVNYHRGSIWAESEPGRGATFIVELPVPQMA